MTRMSDSAMESAQRRGRRWGIVVATAIMTTFIGVCGTQVMVQGFAPASTESPSDCNTGIINLISALRRARAAAAAEPLGERAGLVRFRQALQPEWDCRGKLVETCASETWAHDAIAAIDRLRYAEEHAVRYESVDLAPSRRRVLAIEQSLTNHRSGP